MAMSITEAIEVLDAIIKSLEKSWSKYLDHCDSSRADVSCQVNGILPEELSINDFLHRTEYEYNFLSILKWAFRKGKRLGKSTHVSRIRQLHGAYKCQVHRQHRNVFAWWHLDDDSRPVLLSIVVASVIYLVGIRLYCMCGWILAAVCKLSGASCGHESWVVPAGDVRHGRQISLDCPYLLYELTLCLWRSNIEPIVYLFI